MADCRTVLGVPEWCKCFGCRADQSLASAPFRGSVHGWLLLRCLSAHRRTVAAPTLHFLLGPAAQVDSRIFRYGSDSLSEPVSRASLPVAESMSQSRPQRTRNNHTLKLAGCYRLCGRSGIEKSDSILTSTSAPSKSNHCAHGR